LPHNYSDYFTNQFVHFPPKQADITGWTLHRKRSGFVWNTLFRYNSTQSLSATRPSGKVSRFYLGATEKKTSSCWLLQSPRPIPTARRHEILSRRAQPTI